MTDSLKSNAEKVRLCINTSKTKLQRIGNWNNNTTPITVDERLLEEVQRFQYLCSYQTSDGNIKVDLKSRIGKGSAVFKQLQPVWSSKSLTIKIKLHLFISIIVSTTTYASNIWKSTTRSNQQLDVFQQCCLRSIKKSTRMDPRWWKMTNRTTKENLVFNYKRRSL